MVIDSVEYYSTESKEDIPSFHGIKQLPKESFPEMAHRGSTITVVDTESDGVSFIQKVVCQGKGLFQLGTVQGPQYSLCLRDESLHTWSVRQRVVRVD